MDLIWEGIREAFSLLIQLDAQVVDAAWRSLWISSLAVAVATLTGLPIGLLLARSSFPGRPVLVLCVRAAMSLPTVFIGILCYAMFFSQGPLGHLQLLYTPWAIVFGEYLLALPMVASLSHGAFKSLDPRVGETAWTHGAGMIMRCRTYLSEARVGVTLAILAAFSRCVTELGIAMMVGGNIKNLTRTLATTTALETSKGNLGRGLAVGILLLALAIGVTLFIVHVSHEEEAAKSVGRRKDAQA